MAVLLNEGEKMVCKMVIGVVSLSGRMKEGSIDTKSMAAVCGFGRAGRDLRRRFLRLEVLRVVRVKGSWIFKLPSRNPRTLLNMGITKNSRWTSSRALSVPTCEFD
jgi:hypothetical protein